MDASIIVVLISSLAGVIIAIINNKSITQGNRDRKMYSAKQSILQMIMEDEISVEILCKLPTNHSRILYEYDIYKQNGGNSDIDEKMDEYQDWYKSLESKGVK